ncbi:MAG: hypothetical protein ACREJB_07205 [Planctomycetaceae bacterium]
MSLRWSALCACVLAVSVAGGCGRSNSAIPLKPGSLFPSLGAPEQKEPEIKTESDTPAVEDEDAP